MTKQTVRFNGRDIEVPMGTSINDLKNQINLDSNHFVVEQNPLGQRTRILNNNSVIPNKQDLHLRSLPRYIQGFDLKVVRIQKEINFIKKFYQVKSDEDNLSFIMIFNFSLNSDYNFETTSLMIKIPKNYPLVGLEHFFLKQGLKYRGESPEHYFQIAKHNELAHKNWSKFCIHPKRWKPTKDIIYGDSIITFLELIQFVLDNPQREEV